MTTLAGPNGTCAVGATTSWALSTPKAPLVPMVTDEWLEPTPPIVMLLAAIDPAGNPWPSMRTEVGAVPGKLKDVSPVAAL